MGDSLAEHLALVAVRSAHAGRTSAAFAAAEAERAENDALRAALRAGVPADQLAQLVGRPADYIRSLIRPGRVTFTAADGSRRTEVWEP